MLFLIPEAALHYRGPEVSDNLSRCPETFRFFFGFGTFSDETGGYALFRIHCPVSIVGIYGIGTDRLDLDYHQRFLIINTLAL